MKDSKSLSKTKWYFMNKSLSLHRHAGVAMVEFAIILPLMLMILFGITELGRALYQQNTLDKAVNTGARYLARMEDIAEIDEVTGNCVTPLANWEASAAVVRAKELVAFGSGTDPLLPGLDEADVTIPPPIQRVVNKYDGSESICVIEVSVRVPFASLFGEVVVPFANLGSFTLNARTEERYIGL